MSFAEIQRNKEMEGVEGVQVHLMGLADLPAVMQADKGKALSYPWVSPLSFLVCFAAEAYSEQDWETFVSNEKMFTLMARSTEGNEVVGFVFCCVNEKKQKLKIRCLGVLASHRGKGVASLLMKKSFEAGKSHRAKEVRLFVATRNEPANNLVCTTPPSTFPPNAKSPP